MTEPVLDIVWDDNKARSNLAKHKVSFAQAATVMLDPLALTVFDEAHSITEDRWFTLGQSSDGRLLAISHTHEVINDNTVRIRLISARQAEPPERQQYENVPR